MVGPIRHCLPLTMLTTLSLVQRADHCYIVASDVVYIYTNAASVRADGRCEGLCPGSNKSKGAFYKRHEQTRNGHCWVVNQGCFGL